MDIVSGLQAASTALSLVKDLREIDRGVDEADFKLKLAELMSALADSKMALSDAQSEIRQLRDRVSELENGPVCPFCLTGRIRVFDVKKWEGKTAETHDCQCDNDKCGYSTKRVFLTNTLKYRD